jgi:hypothetical protein
MALVQGDMVVYSKTGTTGKVVQISEMDGKAWAELDSTGLLYDINSLEPITKNSGIDTGKPEKKVAKRKERERGGEKEISPEKMKDEGSLDSSAGVCGAG